MRTYSHQPLCLKFFVVLALISCAPTMLGQGDWDPNPPDIELPPQPIPSQLPSRLMAMEGEDFTYQFSVIDGTAPFVWSIEFTNPSRIYGGGIQMDSTTGSLVVTDTEYDYAQDSFNSYPIQVSVRDAGGNTATTDVFLLVVGRLRVNTTELPSSRVGISYDIALRNIDPKLLDVPVVGGYSYISITTDQSFPSWLQVDDTTKRLQGRAVSSDDVGIYTFDLEVTDSWLPEPITVRETFTLEVLPIGVDTSTPLPTGYAGELYDPVTLSAIGGTPPYTWTAIAGFPSGLTLSPEGELSGSLQSIDVGANELVVEVSDAEFPANINTGTLLLEVVGYELQIISGESLPSAFVDEAYSNQLLAAGGNGSYIWSLIDELPLGLEMTDSGRIHGVPQPGTEQVHLIRIHVADTTTPPQEELAAFILPILIDTEESTLSIGTTELSPGKEGEEYSGSELVTLGGVGDYEWSCVGLPIGLVCEGVLIQGTPRFGSAGTYAVQVTLHDGQEQASRIFPLVILPGEDNRETITSDTSIPVGVLMSGAAGSCSLQGAVLQQGRALWVLVLSLLALAAFQRSRFKRSKYSL